MLRSDLRFNPNSLWQVAEKSLERFSVDGTLIEAWTSMKSFQLRDGGGGDPPAGRNAERDFCGEWRSNATHASATDPDARLFPKGGRPVEPAVLHGPSVDGGRQPSDATTTTPTNQPKPPNHLNMTGVSEAC